jgi:hypothetical protein
MLGVQGESSSILIASESSDQMSKRRFSQVLQASFQHVLNSKAQRSMLLRYSSRREGFDIGPSEYRYAPRDLVNWSE